MNLDKLKSILKDVWEHKIKAYYYKGLICSERNLQAEFYHQLRLVLKEEEEMIIWIEPTLSFQREVEGLSKLKPDLLITKDKEIVCVIELKYKPYGEVFYEADVNKLIKFSEASDNGLRLKTDLQTGNYCNEFYYAIKGKVLTCFAVICNEVAHAAKKTEWKSIENHEQIFLLTGVLNRNSGDPKTEFSCQ